MNSLVLDYDFNLATTGVFIAGTPLDSLNQLSPDAMLPVSISRHSGDISGLINYATSGSQSNGTFRLWFNLQPH
jgi:hypothetical protein